MELLGQNVRVGDEVVLISPESLLHLDEVVAKPIFSSDFVTLWEVVYLLELVKSFVEVALAGTGRPEHVPLVRVSVAKAVRLEDRPHKLVVALE